MKKTKILFVSCIIAVLIMTLAIGCKATTTETSAAAETIVAETTQAPAETTAAPETTAAKTGVWYYSTNIDGIDAADKGKVTEAMAKEKYPDIYATYLKYREDAEKVEPYPGTPGKGQNFAFANEVASFPFCADVQKDIERHAELAGFSKDDVYIVDNQADVSLCISNADIILQKNPKVFVEFGMDEKSNIAIAEKFDAANIPIFAIDVPIPDHPFMGVDNSGTAKLAGEWIAEQIESKFGGIDNVDLIIAGELPQGGEVVLERTKGVLRVLTDKYGDKVKDKIVEIDTGGLADKGQAAVSSVLAAHPKAKNMIIYMHNDQSMTGAIAAFEAAGIFKRENALFVDQGVDASSVQNIKDGKLDAGAAYFPEHYGRYVVPAVLALLKGDPVPDFMYVQSDMVTKDNISKYYP